MQKNQAEQEMKNLQPWGYISHDQFVFVNDIIGSHEWADLSSKYTESQLQDFLQFTWDYVRSGYSVEDAKAKLFSSLFNVNAVEKHVTQQLDQPNQFVVKTGDQVLLKNDFGVRKIQITKVMVDLCCPYAGAYPINLEFFEIGRDGMAGEIDDLWVNAFGYACSNNQNARIIKIQEELSDQQIQVIRQLFTESLFTHDLWAKVVKVYSENSKRIKLTNTMFDKFVELVNSKYMRNLVEIEQMIPEYINQEIKTLLPLTP